MLVAVLRRLTKTGLRRGMSGSRAWMVVGITAGGLRALRRVARNEPDVLYRTRVRAGDRFVITTREPR
ncbi:MAG: hypothetical protein ACT4OX_02350 [Actinomycetota bacterium]